MPRVLSGNAALLSTATLLNVSRNLAPLFRSFGVGTAGLEPATF